MWETRKDWSWLVGNPLVWLTSGRSDRLVTLLKILGLRDYHNQGCTVDDPRWLTFMGSGWDWGRKDCDWAMDGNGIWERNTMVKLAL